MLESFASVKNCTRHDHQAISLVSPQQPPALDLHDCDKQPATTLTNRHAAFVVQMTMPWLRQYTFTSLMDVNVAVTAAAPDFSMDFWHGRLAVSTNTMRSCYSVFRSPPVSSQHVHTC
ncbi:hypothetical protein DTO021D3_8145 [Paecilomyces variotii]|nr:hypothetical protein DTO032I3_4703 [Paecilomyces variotii]KAJ9225111.1 hypothetical protein DTO169C6_2452 [Paecilomyces variotii]KAJ9249946.1 hypothetical protein DTO195F2_8316 [Paecilomyces variotii]KAJ9274974.1 hypothetical protein DTO021D3_8145 [Paecilomyces variotii]KAJ9291526.1 hypothetical protein DTO021C3_883 [Paecilomyces variotii]